jgi:hypothetical protein
LRAAQAQPQAESHQKPHGARPVAHALPTTGTPTAWKALKGRIASSFEQASAKAGVTQAPLCACSPCQDHWPTLAAHLHHLSSFTMPPRTLLRMCAPQRLRGPAYSSVYSSHIHALEATKASIDRRQCLRHALCSAGSTVVTCIAQRGVP